MGGGGKKAHESFVVAPAPSPEVVFDTGAAVSIVAAAPSSPQPAAQSAGVIDEETGVVDDEAGVAGERSSPEPAADEASQSADVRPDTGPAGELADDVLTPVPPDPTVGDIRGTPLLVGGADLDDSLTTLVSYADPAGGGPHEVLMATVDPEAEAKLYESLALSSQQLVAVKVDKEVEGRLPADQEHQLYEQLATVAKSINHHLKAGDAVPDHTKQNFAKVLGELNAAEAAAAGPADEAMVAHYQAATTAIAYRLYPDAAHPTVPYEAGGKVPLVTPYETKTTVTVTEYVPAPAPEAPEGLLTAKLRTATRIGATVGAEGSTSWDGKARTPGNGKEYAVDLGDGFNAVYRPYAGTDAKSPDFSQRGSLELIAPQGAGHGPELVHRLGQLNLVNRPMTAAEGEWAYLRRNVEAQGLDTKAGVKKAMAEADGLEDATTELLIAERAHQAIGLSQPELVRFAKQLRLEAEAKALPAKVGLVRDAVAKACGLADGTALAASAGYDPTPRMSGGWLVWDRFDVGADRVAARAPFAKRGLRHNVTGANMVELFRNGGVLASTERRRVMGIPGGKGMSESADMKSGGAKSVFLRVGSQPSQGPTLFWDDPTTLMRRSDWYAYSSDHFGSLNSQSGHSTSGMTRNLAKVAGFNGGSNEVMFKHGIDLLGDEAPSLVRCTSAAQRKEVLAVLAAKGVTHLRGKPVEEVVK
jgi:hypothetical protein